MSNKIELTIKLKDNAEVKFSRCTFSWSGRILTVLPESGEQKQFKKGEIVWIERHGCKSYL